MLPEFREKFSSDNGDTLDSVIKFLRDHDRAYYLHVEWSHIDVPGSLIITGFYRSVDYEV